MAESVELATILLTDLVGSTRLATSVGPARADDLREEHFELLRDAIVPSGGREVKNTGDGLMVAFSSASAAVQCAVAMQQRFERRYRQVEQGLHIRIGLGAGESTVKDGDYFGKPSTEAARLCTQAPSDGILISGTVKILAGRCDGVEFASAGELELKGFEEPVHAFSVSWAPLEDESAGASRWPLPPVLCSVPPVSYVGRVEERAALEEAMKLTRSGERQVVLLSGEPGIGKTRLASYAAHGAHAEGFAVCWGACSEEFAVPYEPWIEACSLLVEHAPAELLRSHVQRYGGELSRLARSLARRVVDLPAPRASDPETERYLLFSAVAGLLAQTAQALPLCVVLDDLQWADAQSLALLKHLLRNTELGPFEVIATFRDSDLGKDHPLTAVLADLRSTQGVQRIALHGLGADEVAQIMTVTAGHELEADGLELAARIAAETDGNPFFIGEMLRGLRESEALVFDQASERWRVDSSAGIALPESVREVIERRVERLGEKSLEALRVASVIGREFDLELLAATLDGEDTMLLDQLEVAVSASLLGESSEQVGRFRFAHALINQTLYEGLGATRRARTHQRIAEALEDLYAANLSRHLGELALHWRLAAVPVDRAKASDYSLKAGQQALEDLAPLEAVKLFADAVALGGEEHTRERCEALIGLGEAQRQTGVAAFRDTLLAASQIASTLEDPELAARASFANNRGFTTYGEVDAERLAAIDRAIDLDDPPAAARRSRLLALKALELTYAPDLEPRLALAEEAVALARNTGEANTLTEVLRMSYEPLRVPTTIDFRRTMVAELSACATEIGDPAAAFWAHDRQTHLSVELGDFAQAESAFAEMKLIAEKLDQPTMRWSVALIGAGLKLAHGELAAAEQAGKDAFRVGREAGQPDAFALYASHLAVVRRYQGHAADMVEVAKQSVTVLPRIPAMRASVPWMLAAAGRHDEARQILEQEASGFEQLAGSLGSAMTVAHYADAAAETGSVKAASTLYRVMEPWADQYVWTCITGHGHVSMWLGLLAASLGDRDRAAQHLDFACAFHRANEMPLWEARGHLGWAEALAADGDHASAHAHAARALELSREHGYGLFEPRAAALVETGSAAGT